ncbi:YybH family protein [Pedobacter sp. GR22-6]|uniref:YybH family protein n=1 Tax=Pedobacter sp. GR22-6 TaxID=3127957 RepID=UPI00307F5503
MSLSEELIIRQARQDSNTCIANRDVAGVSKYWLPDFIQVAGDGSHTVGKKQIIADWKFMFSQSSPAFERLPDLIKVSQSGDLAWETGTWNYKTAPFYGNYSAMWRKVKGSWLTQCELYVSLNP